MTFRYIGSKTRVVDQIGTHIGRPTGGFFIDAFCGTGAVAEKAAELGWPVRLNDQLVSATTMAGARLISVREAAFERFGGYSAAIALLNKTNPVKGFIWREYSPASSKKVGFERRYFTKENAARIDGIRARIRSWRDQEQINSREEMLLISDLLGSVNRVANIAGTYGCFLSTWSSQALDDLSLKPRVLKPRKTKFEISNVDASRVRVDRDDVVYFDPPYTKRQYASYYHIIETITLGDEPTVEGVSGLRPWRNLASDFCYKVRALNALVGLITRANSRRVLLSYSNQGHVEMDALNAELAPIGNIRLHELATIGRYRPNRVACLTNSAVKEFLLEIRKRAFPSVTDPALVAA